MEPENVEHALRVLKNFTKEFNLNIIVLDPKVYFTDTSSFGFDYFDRVINIYRKLSFSVIDEKKEIIKEEDTEEIIETLPLENSLF